MDFDLREVYVDSFFLGFIQSSDRKSLHQICDRWIELLEIVEDWNRSKVGNGALSISLVNRN